jgi:hypothetical protein
MIENNEYRLMFESFLSLVEMKEDRVKRIDQVRYIKVLYPK